MKGEITVESEVNKGTTFKMFIMIGVQNNDYVEQIPQQKEQANSNYLLEGLFMKKNHGISLIEINDSLEKLQSKYNMCGLLGPALP